MGFLQRSKSQNLVRKTSSKRDIPAIHHDSTIEYEGASARIGAMQRRSVSLERPQTARSAQAADHRKSFSRPRTASSAIAPTLRASEETFIPGQVIEYKQGKDVFNFPTPCSPRVPPARNATTPAVPPANLTLNVMSRDSYGTIGVAIGSPREIPPWGRSYTAPEPTALRNADQAYASRPLPALPNCPMEGVDRTSRKKASWKGIRALFSKRPSKSAAQDPFYKVRPPIHSGDPNSVVSFTRSHTSSPRMSPGPTAGPSQSPQHGRKPSTTRGVARLEARREADHAHLISQTYAPLLIVRTPSTIQKESTSPGYRSPTFPGASEDFYKTVEEDERNDSPLSRNEAGYTLSTPRLELDIPDPLMDRYSVMFEKLLVGRRPSILERRQNNQLNKAAQRIELPAPIEIPDHRPKAQSPIPQRSLTSPHLVHTPSPSFQISSETDGAAVQVHPREPAVATMSLRPAAIQRSNTAPTSQTSPVIQKFNFSKPRIVIATAPSTRNDTASMNGPQYSPLDNQPSLPPTPSSTTTSHSSALIIQSNETSPGLPCLSQAPANPSKAIPATEKAPPTPPKPSNLFPNPPFHHRRPVHLHRSKSDNNPYRHIHSPADLDKQIVQVSVARQVSVSKARKQVREAAERPGGNVVKQPLRPRVVELGANRGVQRKSTVVLIEGEG